MANSRVSTHEEIAEFHRLFEYVDGKLCWRVRPSQRVKVGDVAGTKRDDGYLVVKINGRNRLVHRIVWEMHNWIIPENMEIDHIDHVRSNNEIDNLKMVTNQNNKRNYTRRADNKSGVTGVTWCKRTKKWIAQIMIGGKNKKLGRFSSLDDAANARKEAEKYYGFHRNHGAEKK